MPAADLLSLFATDQPPQLGPGPREGIWAPNEVQRQCDLLIRQRELPGEQAHLLRATVHLWHDHLESAHRIVQAIDSPDGSYVHAVMHRREPDYSNAAYWFRRVGAHPLFERLPGEVASAAAQAAGERWASLVLRENRWDPFAFVDAIELTAEAPADDPRVLLLRGVQAVEFHLLLQRFGANAEKR